jgi:hypothetical protein
MSTQAEEKTREEPEYQKQRLDGHGQPVKSVADPPRRLPLDASQCKCAHCEVLEDRLASSEEKREKLRSNLQVRAVSAFGGPAACDSDSCTRCRKFAARLSTPTS